LSVGSPLLAYGLLSGARRCFHHRRTLARHDLRPVVNLANLASEAGDHAEAATAGIGLTGSAEGWFTFGSDTYLLQQIGSTASNTADVLVDLKGSHPASTAAYTLGTFGAPGIGGILSLTG
jgi:hypothetical protein